MENNEILNEVYVNNPFGFASSDLEIVKSWQTRVSDKFILMKHLKNYSVMMGSNKLYGVVGIVTPLKEMYHASYIPIFIDATLIPFEGKIIYDSIMMPYNIRFGRGAKSGFNDEYREIKKMSGIITSLN